MPPCCWEGLTPDQVLARLTSGAALTREEIRALPQYRAGLTQAIARQFGRAPMESAELEPEPQE